MGFILAENFKNITFLELHTDFNGWNELIIFRIIIEVCPNIKLTKKHFVKYVAIAMTMKLPLFAVLVLVMLAAL